MSQINIQEKSAKNVLTKSKIPGVDYAINPYIGCLHGCQYCYADFMKRYTNHSEDWGRFTDVKINAPQALSKEIHKIKGGTVMLSSVTDPYNPLERKYALSRKILKILLKEQIPVSILTKSDLVLRDIDVLSQFNNCQVGFSFLSIDTQTTKNFEPFTSPPIRRLRALEQLKANGISTYAFIGPIFPYITNLDELFEALALAKVELIYCENFNNRGQAKLNVNKIIKEKYPHLEKAYKEVFNSQNTYWDNTAKYIKELAKKHSIETKIFFHKYGRKTQI